MSSTFVPLPGFEMTLTLSIKLCITAKPRPERSSGLPVVNNGCMVSDCIAADKTLEELTLTQFQTYSPLFGADIYDAIDLIKCCEGRTSYGGPSEASVNNQIRLAMDQLAAWEANNA